MSIIFTPILKTKARAEASALEMCLRLFNDKNIPYLELTAFLHENKKSVLKFLEIVGEKNHFAQFLRKNTSLADYLSKTSALIGNPNRIIGIQLIDEDYYEQLSIIIDYIRSLHRSNQRIAIRIGAGASLNYVSLVLDVLSKNDYLIVDYGSDDFLSLTRYSESIIQRTHRCQILAFSDERPLKSAKFFQDYGYNQDFNTSLIQTIKNGAFIFDGFGSYCSAKNDLTERQYATNNAYGILIIYNFEINAFYSIITDYGDHVGLIYTPLKQKIIDKGANRVLCFFKNTSISQAMLNRLLYEPRIKKHTCSEFIAISIVHYIEEISQRLS